MLKNPKPDFRIARLTLNDLNGQSDHFARFREMVLANDPTYPGIDVWMKNKVLPGIRTGQRTGYVAYLDQKPVISAVVKRGSHAKFCHLKIENSLQGLHLGELFFSLMAMDVRNEAKTIHFTLPESLWATKGDFFNSFGFLRQGKSGRQYRRSDTELLCSAPFGTVWNSVLRRLPKIIDLFSIGGCSANNALVLSVHPEFAAAILARSKTVEVRRSFSKKWAGHRVNLYATAPSQALVGEALVKEVIIACPDEIWQRFGTQIGCTHERFLQYTGGAGSVSAVLLDDVFPYRESLPLSQLSFLIKEELTPPQSFCRLLPDSSWTRAMNVAALLHGTL